MQESKSQKLSLPDYILNIVLDFLPHRGRHYFSLTSQKHWSAVNQYYESLIFRNGFDLLFPIKDDEELLEKNLAGLTKQFRLDEDDDDSQDHISCTTGDFKEILKGNFATYEKKKGLLEPSQSFSSPSIPHANPLPFLDRQKTNFIKLFGKIGGQRLFSISCEHSYNPLQNVNIDKKFMAKKLGSLFGKGIQQIQCGGMFNCALTYAGDLIIAGSVHELHMGFRSPLKIVPNVIQFGVGSKDVAFISIDGSVGMLLASDPTEVQMMSSLPSGQTLTKISVSLTHMFGLSESGKIYNWCTSSLKVFKVTGLEDKLEKQQGNKARATVKQMVSGNNFTNILLDNGEAYVAQFTQEQQGDMEVKQLQNGGLKHKKISFIASSFVHTLALVREDIPSILKWDSERLSDWLASTQLWEISKLVRVKDISGFDIVKADQEFLTETLGLGEESNERKRLLYAVGTFMEPSVKKTELYGWGSNMFGQLGLTKGGQQPVPISINLPKYEGLEEDYIAGISCGKRNSAVWTKRGRAFIMGNCKLGAHIQKLIQQKKDYEKQEKKNYYQGNQKKREKKIVYNRKEQEEPKVVEPFYGKIHKKQTNQLSEEETKIIEDFNNLENAWIEVTNLMSQKKIHKRQKIISVILGQEFLSICEPTDPSEDEEEKRQSKLIDAEKVLKRLSSGDPFIKIEEYSVCYLDRFLGILESNITQFLESGIPYHRIRFFKHKGEVVWDRKKKISKLKF